MTSNFQTSRTIDASYTIEESGLLKVYVCVVVPQLTVKRSIRTLFKPSPSNGRIITADFQTQSINFIVEAEGITYKLKFNHLISRIQPDQCSYKCAKGCIWLKLIKAEPKEWRNAIGDREFAGFSKAENENSSVPTASVNDSVSIHRSSTLRASTKRYRAPPPPYLKRSIQ